MTPRLATLMLLASMAACAAETGDDLNLDALPTYDADTGAGKGDDANCTDGSYREFIKGYLRGESDAAANPCVWGNDASYRLWAYVVGQQLNPLLDAYSSAITKRFTQNTARDTVVTAGTLSADTRSTLAKLSAIRPAHAGKVGAAAWLEYVYTPAFTIATRIVAGDQSDLLLHGADQRDNEITAFEQEWLGYAEKAQPIATEAHAYTLWWNAVKAKVDELTGPQRATRDPEMTINAALMARLVSTHPAGAFDEDQATFQTEITTKLAAEFGPLVEPARWADKLKLQPSGGGAKSYLVWTGAFGEALRWAATDSQRQAFQMVINAKPCAGPEVDMLVQVLRTNLADAGNAPDGTPLAQVVVPTPCDAPM